jgi:hypothetical protein
VTIGSKIIYIVAVYYPLRSIVYIDSIDRRYIVAVYISYTKNSVSLSIIAFLERT